MERRTFLVLGASLLGVAACTNDDLEVDPTSPVSPPPARDPDGPLRARVAAAERALVDRYRAVIAGAPGLAGALAPMLAHHEAHLARIAPGTELPTPSAPGVAASGSGSPGGSTSPSALPSDPAQPSGSESAPAPTPEELVLQELAAAEQAAHRDRVAACDGASSGVLARELCLIAASEAQHAAMLEALTSEASP